MSYSSPIHSNTAVGSAIFVNCSVALFVVLLVASTNSRPIDEKDFAIHRADNAMTAFHLFQEIDAVADLIGKPVNVLVDRKMNEPDYIRYEYPGIVIGFSADERRIVLLRVTGPEYRTNRNIGVNDTKDEVRSEYGPEQHEWPNVIQYSFKDTNSLLARDYLLSFWMEKNTIVGIDINRGE